MVSVMTQVAETTSFEAAPVVAGERGGKRRARGKRVVGASEVGRAVGGGTGVDDAGVDRGVVDGGGVDRAGVDRTAVDGAAVDGAVEEQRRRIEELGRIILAYSEVTERLEKSHEQLTQTVQKLRVELGEKNRQLERRKRLAALGEMAAGMAHEIRNPLGAIALYASILGKEVGGGESGKLVEKISGGVRRMEDIVTKVLQFSRDLRVTPEEGELGVVVGECVEVARARGVALGVEVTCDGEAGVVGRFDRVLLSQALLNVVINGVEATASAGGRRVAVTWGKTEGKLVVRVADEGPGVSGEVMDKIFNPFFTTKDDGTGLGLAIVHRVLEAHDGTVTVRNREGGMGGGGGESGCGAVFELRW